MRALIAALVSLAALTSDGQWPSDAVVIKGAFIRFTTDELGNAYALQGDELLLFGPNGDRLARNSVKTLGGITHIDAFSSLKPMIFSRSQGMLATLDNTLSVQGDPISLPRNGFPQVSLACASVQNCFWLFDDRLLQLTRVDAQLRAVTTTGRLDQMLGFFPHPTFMVEEDGWLYLCDPENGVLVFDLFGGYVRTLPIIGARTIEVRAGTVISLKDGVLQTYDQKSFSTELPVTWLCGKDVPRALDVRIEQGRLYALFEDRIVIARAEARH